MKVTVAQPIKQHPTAPQPTALRRTRVMVISVIVLSVLNILLFFITNERSVFVSTQRSHTTKYLTYIPHSGLSNQRIELLNAIMLAKLLDRTLILPPAILGNARDRIASDELVKYFNVVTNPDSYCPPTDPHNLSTYLHRNECWDKDEVAFVPWSDLHNFSQIESYVEVRHVKTLDLAETCHQFDLDLDKDVFVYKSSSTMSWQLYEDPEEFIEESKSNHLHYIKSEYGLRRVQIWSLNMLSTRQERLIQLGDLYHTERLLLQPQHKQEKNKINELLAYRLDTPYGEAAKNVIDALGGYSRYLSAHIRAVDPHFEEMLGKTIRKVIREISRHAPESEKRCIPVYVATNFEGDPRAEDSPLRNLYERFPCTTTLDQLPDSLLAPLDNVKGDLYDADKPMKSFYIPVIESIIAAHAKAFVGTSRSTFSKYIAHLHQIYKTPGTL